MQEFMNSTFGARPTAFAKGVRVQTKHLGYRKTIKAVSNHTARSYKFDCAEYGREVTVEEYFKLSD
jgi:eukaryotic translation initiation factor 2C